MASSLSNVNGGPTMPLKGPPKVIDMGKDTGKDATNVIKVLGCNPAEASPSATSLSKNTHKGKNAGSYNK